MNADLLQDNVYTHELVLFFYLQMQWQKKKGSTIFLVPKATNVANLTHLTIKSNPIENLFFFNFYILKSFFVIVLFLYKSHVTSFVVLEEYINKIYKMSPFYYDEVASYSLYRVKILRYNAA